MIPLSQPTVTAEMKRKMLEVLDSGRLVKGPQAGEFEEKFARYCGVKHAVTVASGSAAIYLALRTLGISNRDEVICPAHTFIASATPILLLGAKPVFVDVGHDYNIDMDDLEKKLTIRTKAVIAVHLYGQMCDMKRLLELRAKHGFYLVEDACHAHGAEFDGRKSGSFGDIACFSFFPSKLMTVAGEGGMIVTEEEELGAMVKALSDQGRDYRKEGAKFVSDLLGSNFRMSEISAAVGIVQLKHLDSWIERRREIASLYNRLLPEEIVKPTEYPKRKSVYYVYVIRTEKREELSRFLWQSQIETGIHYPVPLHKQPIFSMDSHLPRTEEIYQQILSLPMYPGLKDDEVEYICHRIGDFVANKTTKDT
ncbi:DegT/DnrJ/EryC1/StrS family aminotransferase [Chloroflexota bacterium]